ncbi:MAG: aldo/keto reductase [Selenomonadaceae bacterium]|nr:aldo/keto reductase [Selenomonadaceae bacterium]
MYKLSNGVVFPDVGIGTFELTTRLTVEDAEDLLVEFLLHRSEYLSLIDTAPVYGTEELIGRAVNRAIKNGTPRKNILLETKVPNGAQGYENTLKAFEESLNNLGVDYIDVLLIHWPIPRFHEND